MREPGQIPRRHVIGGQRGSVLIASLIILLAFTLIILGSSQQLLVEQRISSNQNDRQKAFQLAQLTLGAGEKTATSLDASINSLADPVLFGANGRFASSCLNSLQQNGMCLDAAHGGNLTAAWERSVDRNSRSFPMLHPCGNAIEYGVDSSARTDCANGKVTAGSQLWANPRYIIELLDSHYSDARSISGRLYRITARAWGHNENTQVTLQSHFVVPDS
ncbi:pilus assembly PilX family protein [Crenobacter cavernae]|uniref:Pilus assembly protein PilX n=1 Tax=Crenobacter cavernae TaxID=2290923 RepID=A0A345Y5J7_9NEIS|nr:PilX N-terminal domain-containing pilus assembly protein [Crenobacter cavernae]AXK39199.1 pilus assembly protein PilX [Crenobacter cavernae]